MSAPIQIGGFVLDPGHIQAQYNAWLKQQPPALEVLITGVQSSVQGAAIGYLLGSLTPSDPSAMAANNSNPALTAQLKALQSGGPWVQARNLGVLTGVNAALTMAIKKARNGKEDVWGA